jgi:hypothetical protein
MCLAAQPGYTRACALARGAGACGASTHLEVIEEGITKELRHDQHKVGHRQQPEQGDDPDESTDSGRTTTPPIGSESACSRMYTRSIAACEMDAGSAEPKAVGSRTEKASFSRRCWYALMRSAEHSSGIWSERRGEGSVTRTGREGEASTRERSRAQSGPRTCPRLRHPRPPRPRSACLRRGGQSLRPAAGSDGRGVWRDGAPGRRALR